MKILLLSRYSRSGASSRLRSYQYLPYLQEQGFCVTVAPFFTEEYLRHYYSGRGKPLHFALSAYCRRIRTLLSLHQFDLIWVEAEILPWMPAWLETWLGKHTRIPYVVDYDDAIFHRYDQHSSALVRRLLGDKIDRVMRHASLVIAGNDYLAQRAQAAGAGQVQYLPTSIDLERYPLTSRHPARHGESFTIGWIGSRSTATYIESLMGAIRSLAERRNIKLRLVGIGPHDLNTDNSFCEFSAWSESTEVHEIQQFDVGLMPLADGPWEKGKCGYKLIQYMACQKPVIASPVGANLDIVEDNINGFLANTEEGWRFRLSELIDSPELCQHMGIAGRNKVEQHFCIQVNAAKLARCLRTAVESRQALR